MGCGQKSCAEADDEYLGLCRIYNEEVVIKNNFTDVWGEHHKYLEKLHGEVHNFKLKRQKELRAEYERLINDRKEEKEKKKELRRQTIASLTKEQREVLGISE